MPRCPDYLNPDDFDELASSLKLTLSDRAVGALGEIVEHLAIQILESAAQQNPDLRHLDIKEIIDAATRLGTRIELSETGSRIINKAQF